MDLWLEEELACSRDAGGRGRGAQVGRLRAPALPGAAVAPGARLWAAIQAQHSPTTATPRLRAASRGSAGRI